MFPLPVQQKWPARKRLRLQLRNMRMATKLVVPRKQVNLRLCRGHKGPKDLRTRKVQVVERAMLLMKM
jgi:hypothetical protein